MFNTPRLAAPLVLPAVGKHTATLIFFHGLGDNGHGWGDAMEMMRRNRKRLDEIKIVLPHSPARPITLNGGFRMPGWFDLKSLDYSIDSQGTKYVDEDPQSILEAQTYVHSLIQNEISAGIPADRIIVGGFSQGGALSIFSGLTAPVKLAGIVGLSSWLLRSRNLREHIPAEDFNKTTPILMEHGTGDPVVKFSFGKDTQEALKAMGYNVTFKAYEVMQHGVGMQGLVDLEDFLATTLPPKGE